MWVIGVGISRGVRMRACCREMPVAKLYNLYISTGSHLTFSDYCFWNLDTGV